MKKHYYLWILFMIFCSSTFGQNQFLPFTKSNQRSVDALQSIKPSRTLESMRAGYLQVSYTFPGAMLAEKAEKGEMYNFLHIEQFGKLGQVGAPALPMRNDMIAVSKNIRPSVELVDSEYIDYSGYNVYPALELPMDTQGAPAPKFEKDASVYEKDAFFPNNVVNIISDQIMKDARMLRVQVCPVQFNPVTKTLRVYSKMVYQIHTGIDKTRVNTTTDDLNILKRMVLNPEAVQKETRNLKMDSEGDDASKDYIIITHSMFDHAAKKLASWKASLGYKVEIVSKDSWTTDEVKEAIHTRYNTWVPKPSYFVIIGDNEQVPGMNFQTSKGEIYASDLYYSCMDGADDYTPDIARGRISVATVEQSEVTIDKIINYEKNPVVDANFYQKGLNCAQFQDVYDGEAPDGFAARRFCHTSEDIRDYITEQGYDVERIYYTDAANNPTHFDNGYFSNGEALPDELLRENGFAWDGGADDIATAINDGRFYLFHRDHGYAGGTGWAHPEFLSDHIGDLKNGNKLPVVFSINCHTGEYQLPECFAEKFLRQKGGGAVAVFGAAYYSLSGPNDGLSLGMVEAIWPNPGINPSFGNGAGIENPGPSGFENSVTSLGDVLNMGLMRMDQTWAPGEANRLYTYRLFHLFGDPAMKMWTQAPQVLTADLPSSVECGATSLTVSNISNPDAIVTVVQADKLLAKANVVAGKAEIKFAAVDNIDKLVVTVSAPNHRPVFKEYVVTGCSSSPEASFSASKSMIVLGDNNQAVKFTDLSTYSPTSWLWDFGTTDIEFEDETSETSQNPVVKYLTKGDYDVKLTATNENGNSEFVEDKAINVYAGTPEASCFGQTTDLNNNYGIGIKAFALNTINSSSGAAVQDGGYKDFSGVHYTTLIPGKTYKAKVTVGGTNPERVKVYLDKNGDGTLDVSEELIELEDLKGENQFDLTVPYDAELNKMLRLRVISDYTGNDITDACYASENGQTEDYSVLIKPGLATIKTLEFTERGFDFAKLKAKFISDGKGAVTERGIVLSKHTLPTVADIKLVDNSSTAEFVIEAKDLEKGTAYSYRAYIINEFGISYGEELSFETFFGEPDAHVTLFAKELSLSTWQAMSWLDSKSTIKPWGYMIKWAKDDAANVVAPVDGLVESENCMYVDPAEEFAVATELDYDTHYFYKIYPYTNEGDAIDYYTEGDVPVFDANTLPFGEYLPYNISSPEKCILAFHLNTINNTAERPNAGYNDFTNISTDLKPNQSYKATVSFDPGGNYEYYLAGWIDWNHDGWFDSETEVVDFGSYTNAGSLSKSFVVPADAMMGETTLRLVYVYGKTLPKSWGSAKYCTAEDYTVNVDANAVVPGLWTGKNSTVWEDAGNWDEGKLPSETTAVMIQAGDSNYPVLSSESHVKSVTVDADACFTIEDGVTFNVDENIDIAGTVIINGGDIAVTGAFNTLASSQVDINGGNLSMSYWGREASSAWARGTIHLNAGVITTGDAKFSSSGVTGAMAEGFVMNVSGDLAMSVTGWADRVQGQVNILAGNPAHTISASASNADMQFKNLSVNTPGETVYLITDDQENAKNFTVTDKLNIIAGTVMCKNTSAALSTFNINELEIVDGASLDISSTSSFIKGNAIGKGALVQIDGTLLLNAVGDQTLDLNASLFDLSCEGDANVLVKNDISIASNLNLLSNNLVLDACDLLLAKDCQLLASGTKHVETFNNAKVVKQFTAAVADQSFFLPIGQGSLGSIMDVSLKQAPSKDASLYFSFDNSQAEGVIADAVLSANWKIDGDDIMKLVPVDVTCSFAGLDINAENYFWAYKTNVWNTISAAERAKPFTASLDSPVATITAMTKADAPAVTISDASGKPASVVGADASMEYLYNSTEWKDCYAAMTIYLNGDNNFQVRYKASESAIESLATANLDTETKTDFDIILSNYEFAENAGDNIVIADIQVLSSDTDVAEYVYSLKADVENNNLFYIKDKQLFAKSSFDFESDKMLNIKLDVEGLDSRNYTINIIDVNEVPTSINLDALNVVENTNVDTRVATISTIDEDLLSEEKFTYSLDGDLLDNSMFSILGDGLYLLENANFEAKDSYSLKLKSTDKGGLSVSEKFEITVTDANDLPTKLISDGLEIGDDLSSGDLVALLSVEDEDKDENANTFTYELVSCRKDKLILEGNKVILDGYIYVSSYSSNNYDLVVKVTEVESGHSFNQTLTFTAVDVNEAPYFSMYGEVLEIDENKLADSEVGMLLFYDPDKGDDVTFELLDDAEGTFRIDDGTLYTTRVLDFEEKAEYSITAKVMDKAGLFEEDTFTITVKDVNDVPENIALSATSIKENNVFKTLVGSISANDQEGDEISFSLSEASDNALFTIEGSELYSNAIFDFEKEAEYSIELVATDAKNGVSTQTILIQIENENETPVADAGDAQTVNEGDVVTLNGKSSTDADNQELTFAWTSEDGVVLTGANTSAPSFIAPSVDADKDYTFELTVSDGELTSTSTVVVKVKNVVPVNHAPVANAGDAQTVNEGDVVTLNGKSSTDADNQELTFAWTSEDGVVLTGANTSAPSFTAPSVNADKDYTFELTVSDGELTSTSTVVVTVKNVVPVNHAPVANAGDAQTVNEGDVVTLDASASSDVDANVTLTYSWTSEDGISIENNTQVQASFIAPEVDVDTDFEIQLTVSNGTDVSETTVIITVKALVTGIEDIDATVQAVSLYPNPCRGAFKIHLNERPQAEAIIEICNVTGRLVYQGSMFEQEKVISVSSVPGLYLVRIRIGDMHVVKKLIIK
ncbi:putative secreted protein (Por secretion system target) [Ancylomarina subtilis]|uniref:Putative secreted protein (Por secretion system target) n=1 Tax=Ancylomarina subtilis TaxID=1639035 RepID=A0A4V2FSZ3_9BACT|nr:C25 family cysteine peptidase [Ancylomarina subtilis]RZT95985.1 putative secreted protein (Por secretion system target) [Ancylomarina subtilis]